MKFIHPAVVAPQHPLVSHSRNFHGIALRSPEVTVKSNSDAKEADQVLGKTCAGSGRQDDKNVCDAVGNNYQLILLASR